MKLLMDLGNTRLKCAFSTGARVDALRIFSHADRDFVEQLTRWVEATVLPDSVWLASVAPAELAQTVLDVFACAGHQVRRVVTQPRALGLEVGYAQHERLGVDRWLALLALHSGGDAPCVVASVGSALTCDALASGGRHLGGVIAPSPEAMRDALFARAPSLPSARGQVQAFATSTEDGIESGCILAGAALIERCQAQLATQLGQSVRLVVSGGGADVLRSLLPAHVHRPDLVLEGMALWADAVECGYA
ncbi:type III pantothenate kinase [Xanthomonadaceae bacterium JHOS43]|nr:type III pantothenate kinase [Xanthomonadaceae bacterium JHOS43]